MYGKLVELIFRKQLLTACFLFGLRQKCVSCGNTVYILKISIKIIKVIKKTK